MHRYFRIHGDNIVECERIVNLIVQKTQPSRYEKKLIAPSTTLVNMDFIYDGMLYSWDIVLLPGFNKNGRTRWEGNIFKPLKDNGSFLDETPDAIITEVNGNTEHILFAIEFCSALQAGNQAWQRSGRALSTGRAGCPYIYIVEFVKYELNSKTRERKALRYPNAAVPYSYLNFAKATDNFVAQVYVRSESFDKTRESSLQEFDESNFAEEELCTYIIRKMAHLDTAAEEEAIFNKSLNIVKFLADTFNSNKNFTSTEWQTINDSGVDIVDYCIANNRFNFHKTMAKKSAHGKIQNLLKIMDKYSVGFTSKDLPIGIIPASRRSVFAREVKRLYREFPNKTIKKLADSEKNLLLCVIKGFKPHGDDNRPDRGSLPLAYMLSNFENEMLTVIYGPILARNYVLLKDHPKRLATNNGLWKTFLALSDYLLLDAPILSDAPNKGVQELLDTSDFKTHYLNSGTSDGALNSNAFPNTAREFHEDDVDTGIHFLFTSVLNAVCFEGMCNPPGGDWSGFSIIDNNLESRWLSLPRVSGYKRPDHLMEVFGAFEKPVLIPIESKERSADLEANVGDGLTKYIKTLIGYVPNATRQYSPVGDWYQTDTTINADRFIMLSGAAYLKDGAQDNDLVYNKSHCDMLFLMSPRYQGWDIEIVPFSENAAIVKDYLISMLPDNDSIALF